MICDHIDNDLCNRQSDIPEYIYKDHKYDTSTDQYTSVLYREALYFKQLIDQIFEYCQKTIKIRMQEDIQGTEQGHSDTQKSMENTQLMRDMNSKTIYSSGFVIFIATILAYLHIIRDDQQIKPFIDTQSFYSDLNPKIYAGQVHYSRIPVEYWEHRIQMIKSLGLNALSVYIMWNYHEVQKGVFDFETGNKNLTKFLQLAEQYQMKVLIRPGPYVCAEWDFGGFPARLLSIKGLELRANNKLFLDEVEIYFKAVAPIIAKNLWSIQNPQKSIIMLQIENEYGFYGSDIDYIQNLRKIWHQLGIFTEEYYVDWFINLRKSHWPGASVGLNDAFTQFEVDYIKLTLQHTGKVFGGQIYSGWLTHWHQDQMQKKPPQEKMRQYQYLMSHNISYSMYMVHGGTNFGLTAGANALYTEEKGYGGHVTSYDYDAPISEQGAATEKYHLFREQISKYANWQVPEIPDPIPMIKIEALSPEIVGSLYYSMDLSKPDLIGEEFYPFQSEQLQMFNQGIVLYRTKLSKGKTELHIMLHDLGYLLIDGKFHTFIDRTMKLHNKIQIECNNEGGCRLQLFVEAMGHNNYDHSMAIDYKGLLLFNSTTQKQFEWEMFKINLDQFKQISELKTLPENKTMLNNMTVLMKGQFKVSKVGDTYLNMTQFTKGYVWVNGHNLGRYWSVGPQYKLFCPGVWLSNTTTNHIHILEMKYDGKQHIIKGELTLEQNEQ